MAEEEVAKHTKKIYSIWNSKEHSFLHKLQEFFLEILIIVFAVTLSIWFHSWSEHKHEQKEVLAGAAARRIIKRPLVTASAAMTISQSTNEALWSLQQKQKHN